MIQVRILQFNKPLGYASIEESELKELEGKVEPNKLEKEFRAGEYLKF